MIKCFCLQTKLRAVILVLMVILISSGCGDAQPKSGDNSKQAVKSLKPAEAPLLALGQIGRSDAFEIAVTGVEKPTEWTKTPPAGMQYIVVKIKVVNISDKPEMITKSQFGCVNDETGNRGSYEAYTGIKTNPGDFSSESIKPGDSNFGSIIYTIPSTMTKTELHYTIGYALKPNLRFEINL